MLEKEKEIKRKKKIRKEKCGHLFLVGHSFAKPQQCYVLCIYIYKYINIFTNNILFDIINC